MYNTSERQRARSANDARVPPKTRTQNEPLNQADALRAQDERTGAFYREYNNVQVQQQVSQLIQRYGTIDQIPQEVFTNLPRATQQNLSLPAAQQQGNNANMSAHGITVLPPGMTKETVQQIYKVGYVT